MSTQIPHNVDPNPNHESDAFLGLTSLQHQSERFVDKRKDFTLDDPSFGHIANKRERRARVAAQELHSFIARFPEFSHHVEESVPLILKDAEKSAKSDRDQVFLAIEQGCTTIAEILDEPGITLSKWRIRHAIDWLLKLGLIDVRSTGPREGSNHNKEIHYFTLHSSAFFGK